MKRGSFRDIVRNLWTGLNLRLKSALLFAAIVTLIVFAVLVNIYFQYTEYRKEEFYMRLEQKALTTYRLLIDVKEIDHELLRIIDRNTINELYDEKILIFDENDNIIYSSIDDKAVHFSPGLLNHIRKEKKIQYSENGNESLGLFINEPGSHKIIIATAFDKYGMMKLHNLQYVLWFSALLCLVLTGLFAYFYVKQVFKPLDILNMQVKRISETNLAERVPVGSNKDELSDLARNFNLMIDRIEKAFMVQKSFVHSASHELRTPLANMVLQTERALNRNMGIDEYRALIRSLHEDHRNMEHLVNALLQLSKYENTGFSAEWPVFRVDELIYKTIDEVQQLYPGYIVHFDFANIPEDERMLQVQGHEALVRTAFTNLIRNACEYSDNNTATISLDAASAGIVIRFSNNGDVLSEKEKQTLFTPFFRAANSAHKKGYGLGLSITQRIIALHRGSIRYQAIEVPRTNIFTVTLPSN